MSKFRTPKSGFTLLEIMLALGILVTVFGLVWPNLNKFYFGLSQSEDCRSLAQALRLARDRSLGRFQSSVWGVYLATSTPAWTIFAGPSYANRYSIWDWRYIPQVSTQIQFSQTPEIIFSPQFGTTISQQIILSSSKTQCAVQVSSLGGIFLSS
ncbi:prepilin-type N-terminal cleavage/methylation domain-containing protein [Candidatus Parcubacteria bacterium]|nr:MAG: prepilin-type N-terminal cleavage/methylation domain-containing protein [Candidatus Parcubacteria bacterium]